MIWPVTKEAAGMQRNAATAATSSGSPNRFRGTFSNTLSDTSLSSTNYKKLKNNTIDLLGKLKNQTESAPIFY